MMLLQATQQAIADVKLDPSSYSFDSVAINGVCVWLIQQAKKSQWKPLAWLNEGAPVRIFSVIVAALAAAGMTADWSSTNGVGTLVISGISLSSVVALIRNVLFQHGIYKGTYGREKEVESLRTELVDLQRAVRVTSALVIAHAPSSQPTQTP